MSKITRKSPPVLRDGDFQSIKKTDGMPTFLHHESHARKDRGGSQSQASLQETHIFIILNCCNPKR